MRHAYPSELVGLVLPRYHPIPLVSANREETKRRVSSNQKEKRKEMRRCSLLLYMSKTVRLSASPLGAS